VKLSSILQERQVEAPRNIETFENQRKARPKIESSQVWCQELPVCLF
jgi:hypothetical protein